MSAICGIININHQPVQREDIDQMTGVLNHWQADKVTNRIDGNVAMGHLMLYNTPESLHEELPYHITEAALTITADVILYNREELFKKLDIKREPALVPDSYLILKAYEKYGQRCLEHLTGDFAFAIYDANNGQLFCARDHIGVKPFFYYKDNKRFLFASEKKGILAFDDTDCTVDELYFYTCLIQTPKPLPDATYYLHIRRLPPAHYLLLNVQTGETKINRYWTIDPNRTNDVKTQGDYHEGIKWYFEQAVTCRQRSAYPVGIELSGGLDSTAITGVAFKHGDRDLLHTFSNVLPAHITDEAMLRGDGRKLIEEVIKFNNIRHYHFIDSYGLPAAELFAKAAFINEGLEVSNPLMLQSLRRDGMKQGVRTMLSGAGGDQLATSKGAAISHFVKDAATRDAFFKAGFSLDQKLQASRGLIPLFIKRSANRLKLLMQVYPDSLITASKYFNIPPEVKYRLLQRHYDVMRPYLAVKSYKEFQIRFFLSYPGNALRLETDSRCGMHFKQDTRFPMADIRLAEFMIHSPDHLKFDLENKRIHFKKAVGNYLPGRIFDFNGKLIGTTPFDALEMNNFQQLARKILPGMQESFFNKNELTKLLDQSNEPNTQNFNSFISFASSKILLYCGA